MLNVPIILFFISLIGIMIMIGRKLSSIPSIGMIDEDYTHPFVPDIQKVKHLTIKNTKRLGHFSVVSLLRLQVKTANFLKSSYGELKEKIKSLNKKRNGNGEIEEKVEVSKFLRMVSDYKEKIRDIRHKIKEEEKD